MGNENEEFLGQNRIKRALMISSSSKDCNVTIICANRVGIDYLNFEC